MPVRCVAELPRGAGFNRAKFARGGPLALFTSVNAGGDGHLLRWEQDAQGQMLLTKRAKAHNMPITAFDISISGRFLGTGTSEGDLLSSPFLSLSLSLCDPCLHSGTHVPARHTRMCVHVFSGLSTLIDL